MKKLLFLFSICIALCFVTPVAAYAEDTTYSLNEVGLSVTVPDDYFVLTRDMPEDDAVLQTLGMSKEYLSEFMTANSMYLNHKWVHSPMLAS